MRLWIVPLCLLLIGVDQGVKQVIRRRWMGRRKTWGILGFRPVVNRKLTFLGNYFPLMAKRWVALGTNAVALLVLLLLLLTTGEGMWWSLAYGFALAGGVSSMIDKLAWGGSLDFIQIRRSPIFDLKDVYLLIAIILLAVLTVIESTQLH